MGWFDLNGVGVEQNSEQAKRWYKKSPRQPDPSPMFSPGQMAYDQRDDLMLWCRSGARGTRAVPGRYSGLANCSGGAMAFRWIKGVRWRSSRGCGREGASGPACVEISVATYSSLKAMK